MSLRCWKLNEVCYNTFTLRHILLQRLQMLHNTISFSKSNITKREATAVPTTSRWVSVQRDVTGGNACPQVLTKRLKVKPQRTKPQNSKEFHILDPDTNRFVTWFGVKTSAIRCAELFSVWLPVGGFAGVVEFLSRLLFDPHWPSPACLQTAYYTVHTPQ